MDLEVHRKLCLLLCFLESIRKKIVSRNVFFHNKDNSFSHIDFQKLVKQTIYFSYTMIFVNEELSKILASF